MEVAKLRFINFRELLFIMIAKRIVVVLFASLLLSSCLKDLEDTFKTIKSVDQVQWDPTIAAPLVNTRLTVSDFLSDTTSAFIEIDPDNLIHVVYRGDLTSLDARDFVRIPKQSFDGSFSLPSGLISQFETNGTLDFSFNSIFEFDISGAELDSILMGSSYFFTELTSDFQHDLVVTVELPHIKKSDGNPVSIVYNMPYNGSPVIVSSTENLSNSFFDLTKSGDKTFGQVLANFNITMNKVGSNPTNTTDEISFKANFLTNEYNVAYGLVETKNIAPSGSDTLKLDIFNNIGSDLSDVTFRIADPRIKVIVANSYGIPIDANITEFSSFSKSQGKTTLTGVPSPLPFPAPTQQQIDILLKDSFELNKDNSNIDEIVSQIPDYIVYGYSAIINPGNQYRNFISRNSQLFVTVDVDIPLYGSTNGFVLKKDINLDSTFKNLEDIEEVEEVSFRLFMENDFPIDVDFQLYFMDDNNNLIDSLITSDQLLIESATVGADGRIITPNVYTVDISMNKARFELIRQASIGKIEAKLNTYNNGSGYPDVKFFNDYGLSVKLGVQGHGVINVKTK